MSQPRFIVALICAVGSYALMSFVMTGAPLLAVGCGFTADQATAGISWHVMAMFAPSFFTGRLISYFGEERIVILGLALLLNCAAVALSGIAALAVLDRADPARARLEFRLHQRNRHGCRHPYQCREGKVQGVHDFILFGSVALSSLASGKVYNAWGWGNAELGVFPVVFLCLAALAVLALRTRRIAA